MLQLSLGYVIQAEREREVTEDLRNRQSLLPPRDSRTTTSAAASRTATTRRSPVRARSLGA
jgi:hypothetical protein